MSYAETCKFQRGGRRPGSGRKKLGHVPLMLHISPEAAQALKRCARRQATTPSRIVEDYALALP